MQKTAKTRLQKALSLFVCTVLIAAMALSSGCTTNDPAEEPGQSSGQTTLQTTPPVNVVTVLGTGNTEFAFQAVDDKGQTAEFLIRTDKTTVGEALQEVGLIAGDEGPFGLYVKTVNGLTFTYEDHGKYWAFYENDAYAMSGVDTTEIVPGVTYSFRVE